MKKLIKFMFVAVVLAILPLNSIANLDYVNNTPGCIKKIIMRSHYECNGGSYTYDNFCEHYLGYGDSMSYTDYSGGGCSTTYSCDSCTTIPNDQGPYPNIVNSDAWMVGGAAGIYYNLWGASQHDMNLHWSPDAHDTLLNHGLLGKAPQPVIDTLKAGSREFDRISQSTADSNKHAMRIKGQSVEDAIYGRDIFITEQIYTARIYATNGDLANALYFLSCALHPVMDYSSPMHTDANGEPKFWRGLIRDGWGHSPNDLFGHERNVDITPQVYSLEDPIILWYFVYVFKGTPLASQVFTSGWDPNQVPTAVLPHN